MIQTFLKNSKPFLGCLAIVAVFTITANACPTCKQAVAENGGNTIRGFFWSICFMMSMPFLIFTTMSTLCYLQFRKAGNLNQRYSPEIAAKLGVGGTRQHV